MALSIVVNGGGTFSASMEEGPVSFTASLGAVPGPQGPTGPTGPTGVVAATSPITYNSGTQTVGIDPNPSFTSVSATNGSQFSILDAEGLDFDNSSSAINNLQSIAFSSGSSLTNLFNISFASGGAVSGLGELGFADSTIQTTAFVGEARKEILTARNNTGSTIAAGKVVYLSGATGNKPTVALALASSESTSARTIGITAEAIADNADGKVVISGAVENIDTSAFTAGQVVYLSSSTAGGLQTTLPAAPLHGVVIGIVTRSNPSVGSIEVFVQNYQELHELSDVSVADRANNDGLFYNSSAGVWQARTIAEVLGYTPANNASLASYAPLASPTFTGTVTIPEGASISGFLTTATAASTYAPLASPTFTGDPKAPTPSTSDNDTSIATTAFVNAYCPAASTTVAGKVELATDAEAIAGTSTSLAVTPSGALANALNPEVLSFFAPLFTSGTSGAGSGGATVQGNQRVTAPTTAVGYGYRNHIVSNAILGRNHETGQINFDKRIVWEFRSARMTATTDSNTVGRILLGKNSAAIAGNPTTRAIGIRFAGSSNVELIVHDGTSLTAVSTSFSPSGAAVFECMIVSEGNGTVTLFINGTQEATTTAGPTGNSATSPDIRVEAENLASISTTPIQLYLSNAKIRFAP